MKRRSPGSTRLWLEAVAQPPTRVSVDRLKCSWCLWQSPICPSTFIVECHSDRRDDTRIRTVYRCWHMLPKATVTVCSSVDMRVDDARVAIVDDIFSSSLLARARIREIARPCRGRNRRIGELHEKFQRQRTDFRNGVVQSHHNRPASATCGPSVIVTSIGARRRQRADRPARSSRPAVRCR